MAKKLEKAHRIDALKKKLQARSEPSLPVCPACEHATSAAALRHRRYPAVHPTRCCDSACSRPDHSTLHARGILHKDKHGVDPKLHSTMYRLERRMRRDALQRALRKRHVRSPCGGALPRGRGGAQHSPCHSLCLCHSVWPPTSQPRAGAMCRPELEQLHNLGYLNSDHHRGRVDHSMVNKMRRLDKVRPSQTHAHTHARNFAGVTNRVPSPRATMVWTLAVAHPLDKSAACASVRAPECCRPSSRDLRWFRQCCRTSSRVTCGSALTSRPCNPQVGVAGVPAARATTHSAQIQVVRTGALPHADAATIVGLPPCVVGCIAGYLGRDDHSRDKLDHSMVPRARACVRRRRQLHGGQGWWLTVAPTTNLVGRMSFRPAGPRVGAGDARRQNS